MIKAINTGCLQTGDPISEEGEEDEVIGSGFTFPSQSFGEKSKEKYSRSDGRRQSEAGPNCILSSISTYLALDAMK